MSWQPRLSVAQARVIGATHSLSNRLDTIKALLFLAIRLAGARKLAISPAHPLSG